MNNGQRRLGTGPDSTNSNHVEGVLGSRGRIRDASFKILPAHAQNEPDRVTMKLDDFLKLYEDTKNRPKDPERAPWDAAVASARYSGDDNVPPPGCAISQGRPPLSARRR